MLVSLHSGSTIPMEQTLLPRTQSTIQKMKHSTNVVNKRLLLISVPVFVSEVHPQDDVLLGVLMAAGVDHHHVANPFRPPALQAHGLWEPVNVTSADWAIEEKTQMVSEGNTHQFDAVFKPENLEHDLQMLR